MRFASICYGMNDKIGTHMSSDQFEIVQKVSDQLVAHPNATLPILAERLGVTEQVIENALREIEGLSFQEFQANRRLEQAFRQLGEMSIAANGPWEITRARQRLTIPKATVRYMIYSFGFRKTGYSNQCPLVDVSQAGLAFLTDQNLKPQKRILLLLKLPGIEDALHLRGSVVYSVATGIAYFRFRIGVQFLPFSDRRGHNPLKAREILTGIEKTFAP
jgi:AraC-like DNA-binding protein